MKVWAVFANGQLRVPLWADEQRAHEQGALIHRVNGDQVAVLIEAIDVSSGWKPEHGDSRCQDCGAPNVVWTTDNDLWNLVMGGPDATEDPGGVVCLTCFGRRADQAGVHRVWKLVVE